ncbi:hypothetical protein TEA_015690 [Camellia sinensis var. sinensis]|uniref:DUF7152 domain-containing protein n=1 Tax=Camellia sinensis var. sinensis TaxID=542762 RepID=A0A4S4D880_CAMSN|nr:hypothetical protein TEA_015690 [Camellia sinensis var. sinensis]
MSSSESISPPSELPPMSPMTTNSLSRALGSNSINEMVASLHQLQLNRSSRCLLHGVSRWAVLLVKDLPRGKHLLQLRSDLPSRTHKFESEVIEVDLEKHTQIHVGPIRYKVEEDFHKQELTPAPVYPLIVGVSAIALFISMPRIKDLYQATMGVYTSSSVANGKKEVRKPVIRKKTY